MNWLNEVNICYYHNYNHNYLCHATNHGLNSLDQETRYGMQTRFHHNNGNIAIGSNFTTSMGMNEKKNSLEQIIDFCDI